MRSGIYDGEDFSLTDADMLQILAQKPETLPEQTGTGVQMDDWSKDVTHGYLEQETTGRNKSTQLDEQLPVNSKGSMHQKSNELVNEATYEGIELPEQRSRNFQVISPHLGDETAYCTTEKSNFLYYSIMEHRNNDLHYKCMIPCQVTSDLNEEETIALLLKELDILKASNKKLQEKLTKEDKEQRKLKLKLELQEKATEAQIAEKTAALVEDVYFAQRERDEAIMSRLQLANEERDEAIARAKHMEMSLKLLENINPEENDMTLQELLNRINNADTGIAIQKNGAIIVDRIYKTKECKKRITAEEMNAVIEERDAALSQCKRLEQELHHLKEQNQTSANNVRHLTAENNQERALKVVPERASLVKGMYHAMRKENGLLGGTHIPAAALSVFLDIIFFSRGNNLKNKWCDRQKINNLMDSL
ncbi:mirror-image polydactyly gene 1 protein isoform X6 [Balaenoptera acutorostrata]|uniref:Mirror-image polydactyly gene 1 protein isoform X6 n=1 Tax=Balaenoptera acutorostrata TaxID=9767 RepID=A0A452CFT5_BALAC|nr:mirror-image polydactyly gene 1 protein isoform X6 [Balaenoptera acutorostrata]